jgi:polysaccharide export outer membrane protein
VTVYAHDLKVLDLKARVSDRGTVTLPLLGELRAGGENLKSLEDRITKSLDRDYFINPRVLLDIDQFRKRTVFVLGQVNKPGEYDITGPRIMHVVQAISLAGGLTKGAALNSTRITRMEEGREKVIRIKLKDIIEEGKKKLDAVVRDRDIIFVPERFF